MDFYSDCTPMQSDSPTADLDHANVDSDYESVNSMDTIFYFDYKKPYSEQVSPGFDTSSIILTTLSPICSRLQSDIVPLNCVIKNTLSDVERVNSDTVNSNSDVVNTDSDTPIMNFDTPVPVF